MGKRKLTVKEAKLVKAKVEGKTHKEAYIEAGYSPSENERAMVSNTDKTLKKPHVKEAFEIAMAKANLTEDRLALKLSEGLDATKAVVMGKESSDSFVDVQPDYAIRHKYLETALRVKGIGKNDETPTTNFIQVVKEQNNKYV